MEHGKATEKSKLLEDTRQTATVISTRQAENMVCKKSSRGELKYLLRDGEHVFVMEHRTGAAKYEFMLNRINCKIKSGIGASFQEKKSKENCH